MALDLVYRKRRRQFLKSTGGIVTAGVLAGCSDDSGGGNGGEENIIEMNDDLEFVPDTFEVPAGETVTWENVGSTGHSVTAYEDEIPDEAEYFASGGFDSESTARNAYPDEGNIPGGETYEYTFETEGEYGYFCIPHEQAGMTATITVQ